MKPNFLNSFIFSLLAIMLIGTNGILYARNAPGRSIHSVEKTETTKSRTACHPALERTAVNYAAQLGYRITGIMVDCNPQHTIILTTLCGLRLQVITGQTNNFLGLEILPN
jgi:hypothetical protein